MNISRGAGSVYPKKLLKGCPGTYLHCDGYVGYKKLENITFYSDLVFAKRKFNKTLIALPNSEIAKTGENDLHKIFALEDYADKQGMSL